MTSSQPEYHLQRINSDGATEPPQVYTLSAVPFEFQTTRRSFIGAGLTAGAALGLVTGCGSSRVKSPSAHSQPGHVFSMIAVDEMLISGASDSTIKIWSLKYGQLQAVLQCESNARSLAVTPDGAYLASGEAGGSIALWSLENWELVKTFGRHSSSVETIVISPDGNTLASQTLGGSAINVFRIPDGKHLFPLTDHEDSVISLVFTPHGDMLASGSSDKTIRLWRFPDGHCLKCLTGHTSNVYCLAITHDGQHLISGSIDKTLKLWSLPEGDLIDTLDGQGRVLSVRVTPDGTMLVSAEGHESGAIKLWSLPAGTLKATLDAHHNASVDLLEIASDGTWMASGSTVESVVKVWSLPDGELLATLTDHDANVTALAIASDGMTLASADSEGQIILWDAPSGKHRCRLIDPKANVPNSSSSPRDGGGGSIITPTGRGSSCSCNKICTCIPVCQALHLLNAEPVVRGMAEQLLYVMGARERTYLNWAMGETNNIALRERIRQVLDAICMGKQPDKQAWPSIQECAERLTHPDEVVAIMAAQSLVFRPNSREAVAELSLGQQTAVSRLLRDAEERPWFKRYEVAPDSTPIS